MIEQTQFYQIVESQLGRAGMHLIGSPRLTATGRVIADVDCLPSRSLLEATGFAAWGRGLRFGGVGPYVAFEMRAS